MSSPVPSFVRPTILNEINKQVVRRKLARQRHCLIEQGIQPEYLDSLFPPLLELFAPQSVQYNGGIAGVKDWKISCYLEVMPGGVPTTEPNVDLLQLFLPLLEACNVLFCHWYRQQHACNHNSNVKTSAVQCERLMTFITRYTPAPGEQALLKHVDGAGKVDGSIVVALPIDRWSPGGDHLFEGGGLTFWDGKGSDGSPLETHYDTRSGDIAFIDRAVWHQADPITKGTRWALVIFYRVL
ncbi:hypothetical protein FisN_24Lh076 [Fistulifera solaris]|uniref:Prolyl 4-hydroxylase alpha subunit Fe(2+) 2OG dioxygenase domain-containing protein n=1 Tax=Fistulifera solaris TaxID=1519565 RepID=A0A1Z5K9I2_FISSO|nr:hypothetical protein FisN_24Lh076 [Fistulifera solaris]|eukprot:GAX22795.1 hypothetical protein FisN_24Lh076 [Fistulifera solaris]